MTNLMEHNTFGGLIFASDFNCTLVGNLDYTNKESSIASRIASDWRFDKECMKNAKERNRKNA